MVIINGNTNATSGGLVRRVLNSIKAFFKSIRHSLSPPSSPPATPLEEPPAANGLDGDEPYEEYSTRISRMDDIIVNMGLHKRISASHKYMYEMGRRDGALGIKMNITGIARASAQAMFRHIYVILKGKIGALKATLESKEKIMQDDEKLYSNEQRYYDYLQYQYRFFPRSHSLLLFFIYAAVALALIIADMPLALQLIQRGFNLPGPGFEELFKPGNFLTTIAANWETSLTALGVALSTVYIKIFYDEFIGTPYANSLMTSKKFLEEMGIENPDKIDGRIRREGAIKVSAKLILFIGTIAAIMLLALFRFETAKEFEKAEFTKIPYAGKAFVAITLLFPVIGGICLSYALNNIQNLLRYSGAKRRCEKTRSAFQIAVEAYTVARINYEDITAATEGLNEENSAVDEFTNHLAAFYTRGYAIGGMQPEKYTKGEDFFNKIQEWRNIAIARKINHNIYKLN